MKGFTSYVSGDNWSTNELACIWTGRGFYACLLARLLAGCRSSLLVHAQTMQVMHHHHDVLFSFICLLPYQQQ